MLYQQVTATQAANREGAAEHFRTTRIDNGNTDVFNINAI